MGGSVDRLEAAKHAEKRPGMKSRAQDDPAENAQSGVQPVERHAQNKGPFLASTAEVSEDGKNAGDEHGHDQCCYGTSTATVCADSVGELSDAQSEDETCSVARHRDESVDNG